MSTLPDQPSSDSGSLPRGSDPEAEQATLDSRPLLFRRYQVRQELGRGGMGVVVLAHDTELDIPVALKLVPDMVVKDTEAIADLRKEVLRGMALMHPGVVRTTNFERDEGGAGIVMEYIEGETLGSLKQRQPQNCFDPEQILPWIVDLCAVLDYAHREAHIIHRDLKPRNLMITKAGKLKVADFGIAATLSDSVSRNSMEGVASGTPSYMSPQQAQGMKPSHLDDIHALGATIYELLTGKPPFFRGNAASLFGQVLQVVPPRIAERREELGVTGRHAVSQQWEETIAACLAKDPADRPQSAGEFLTRLRRTPRASAAVGSPSLPSHPPSPLNECQIIAVPAKLPMAAPVSRKLDESAQTVEVVGASPEPLAAHGMARIQAPARQRRVSPWVWAMIVLVPGVIASWLTFGGGMGKRDTGSLQLATPRTVTPTPVAPTPVPVPPGNSLKAASKDAPFVNSLGMEFVPVPGANVLFCRWETRMKDYAEYMKETGITREKRGFELGPTHPVVNVSWEEAKSFCAWLSKKEGREYRLPTDHEWSCAVGIGDREDARATPIDKSDKLGAVYPWGTQWPPPDGAGNYSDTTLRSKRSDWGSIEGYRDGFADTAPVGSFRANPCGLYDLSGNVWEWCEDWYGSDQKERVLRGGSWDGSEEIRLRSSYRDYVRPEGRAWRFGFRCVLVNASVPPTVAPKAATKEAPFVNSLGMEFVPVPGTNVLFCRWETRMKDYAEYAKEKGITPAKPAFEQGPTHPVVNVSWEDAKAFCAWLSKKDGREYRIPTDHEWSYAVGVGDKEDRNALPKDKRTPIWDVYPWGGQWPPPKGAGNYLETTARSDMRGIVLEYYQDGFARTAPVGSFSANPNGIYDLSGNVWEWCEDWYDNAQQVRVLRGGSWNDQQAGVLRSSFRSSGRPTGRANNHGFRCVLVVSGGDPATAAPAPPPDPIKTATKDAPFVNSLGMEFVPVPGTNVLFCRWETRVKDYAEYAKGVSGIDGSWEKPGFGQTGEHPVVFVSSEDAQAFCAWLSKKEGREYRLPTDAEWSAAVGLGNESGSTPEEKAKSVSGFPWGGQWPPTDGAGNFLDATAKSESGGGASIADYRDGFAQTAPVRSFQANPLGLHDLSGNVWEWCEDWYNNDQKERVLRGGSWRDSAYSRLQSSFRFNGRLMGRGNYLGFRCVLVVSGG